MPRGRPDYNLSGSVPGDHNLDVIRRALQQDPRERHLAIVEIRNMRSSVDHPLDGPDKHDPIITVDSLWVITDAHERDQLTAMAARARLNNNPTPTLDDEAFAQDAEGQAAEAAARQRLSAVPPRDKDEGDQ